MREATAAERGAGRHVARSTSIQGGDASPPQGRGVEGGRLEHHGGSGGITIRMVCYHGEGCVGSSVEGHAVREARLSLQTLCSEGLPLGKDSDFSSAHPERK